jgi:hypothetical protein
MIIAHADVCSSVIAEMGCLPNYNALVRLLRYQALMI